MRPSNYHYIKRIFTRYFYRNGYGCFTSILSFPFRVAFFIVKWCMIICFGFIGISLAFAIGFPILVLVSPFYIAYKIFKNVNIENRKSEKKEERHIQISENILDFFAIKEIGTEKTLDKKESIKIVSEEVKKEEKKLKNKYELERFARECNAYVEKEDRKQV